MRRQRKILQYTASAESNIRYDKRCATGWIILLLLTVPAGCQFYGPAAPKANYYYLNPSKDLSAIGRVAIIEPDNDSSYPQISGDVTRALFQALQKKQLFGLTVIRQSNPAWRSVRLGDAFDSQTPKNALGIPTAFTLEQLVAMRKKLNCDAALLGTITGYQPYPHMALGLRLKLVDLADGQLLWALEQVWDGADNTTELRIEEFYRSRGRSDSEALERQLAVVSPLKFVKFVSYEVAETLQSERKCPKISFFVQ